MEKGKITVFSGEGRGKTAAALGTALDAAAEGKTAVIIQFLKGKANRNVTTRQSMPF